MVKDKKQNVKVSKLVKRRQKMTVPGLGKSVSVDDAIAMVLSNATARFDETVELAVNLGVDPRHADQMVRGVVVLPHGTGRVVRVAVVSRNEAQLAAAQAAGADLVGNDDIVERILAGEIPFDSLVATPDMMPTLTSKVAKILGQKGLMPNPKMGTVAVNVVDSVKAIKAGQVNYRVEKAGIVHAGVGKVSFGQAAIKENFLAFMRALLKSQPSGVKGQFLRRLSIGSTMGVGVSVDLSTLSV
jgi:large subunit ribosomal protein L1